MPSTIGVKNALTAGWRGRDNAGVKMVGSWVPAPGECAQLAREGFMAAYTRQMRFRVQSAPMVRLHDKQVRRRKVLALRQCSRRMQHRIESSSNPKITSANVSKLLCRPVVKHCHTPAFSYSYARTLMGCHVPVPRHPHRCPLGSRLLHR